MQLQPLACRVQSQQETHLPSPPRARDDLPMTQYISSFLIEPIVQQARRFSHSSNSSADHRHQRPSLPTYDTSAVRPDLNHEETQTQQQIISHVLVDDISVSPVHDDLGDDYIQPWHQPEHSRLADESSSHLSHHVDDDISNNPSQSVRNQFRSPSGSDHGSVDSITSQLSRSNEMPASRMSSRRQLNRNASGGASRRKVESLLPANDGMSGLRSRIRAIQESSNSNEEKAFLMQSLMTQTWRTSQASLIHTKGNRGFESLDSVASIDRPPTPASSPSNDDVLRSTSPSTPTSSIPSSPDHILVAPEDRTQTYYQKPEIKLKSGTETARGSTASLNLEQCATTNACALGCRHYKRNIKLQCSTCSRWYTCRFCHDEIENHPLIRKDTENMLCMICGHAQRAAGICDHCGERAAWYYCAVCKLWDDDPEKSIYHCDDCGICRIGKGLGKDFYHCKVCQACISVKMQNSHKCIERSTDCDCPICGEYMFTSPETVVFMKCGHSIHHRCYYAHMKSSYRCPICSKSLVNMERQFRQLQDDIDSQPMPPRFDDTTALISCNDCSATTTVKYHWLGLRCLVCDSFNTAQLRLLNGHEPHVHNELPMEMSRQEEVDHADHSHDTQAAQPVGIRPSQSRVNSAPTLLERFGSPSSLPSNLPSFSGLMREFRAASPLAATRWPPPRSDDSLDEDAEIVGTDEDDEEELDFWGGESPRLRPRSADAEMSHRRDTGHFGDGSDGDNDLYDDDVDEDMNYTSSEDEDEDADQMEIMGHR